MTNSLDPTSDMVSFEFEGDSETIKANKFVLAAHSPVFKRQFFGNCVEAMTGRVAVTDFSSVSFRLFLSMLLDSHVAYTLLHTPADVNMLNMVEVWAIADKYCAKDVRNIAEAALLQSAGPQNVKELLQSCRRYCSAELAQRLCEQVVSRSSEDLGQLFEDLVAEDHIPSKRPRLGRT